MGNGASYELPDPVDKQTAKNILEDKYDEAKFDAAAKDGVIPKEQFLKMIEEAKKEAEASSGGNTAGGEGSEGAGASSPAPAAEAAAAPEAAKSYLADPEGVDVSEVEALHSRVRWNKEIPQIQEVLKANPAMVHARDSGNGNYPLHIAAQNSHLELVKLLLGANADPNKQNGSGQTALHMTQTYELDELSDLLLAAGADPHLKNADGHEAGHGLEGKKNARYRELKQLVTSASEEALVKFFSDVVSNPENLDKTELMKIVNFQAKKAMKAAGSWTETVNTKFTEMVRAMP